jgi:hypothetical protein
MESYMPRDGMLVEFGVLNGSCLRRLIRGSIDVNNPFNAVWGFDSWEGLPEETKGIWENPDWKAGAFSLKEDINVKTNKECIEFVKKRVYEFVPEEDCPKLNFVSGFFDKSLTAELGKVFTDGVSYAHIDVDIHRSTLEVLTWIFDNNMLMQNAVVRFDDWLYNGRLAGNNLAFAQITNRYEVVWQQISSNVYLYSSHRRM